MAGPSRFGAVVAVGAALWMLAGAAGAEEDDDGPSWWREIGVGGKVVFTNGSDSKQLEDHNLQTGGDGRIGVDSDWIGDRRIQLDAFGQTGERQGYVFGKFDQLGLGALTLDLSSWREYYNSATGTPERSADFFPPFTNDGNAIYGTDDVHTDWTTGRAGLEGHLFDHDLFVDFFYRRVDGDQTLLKGGTVGDPAFLVGGSGPGTVLFDLPAKKDVEYDSIGGRVGANSGLADINWQLDVAYDQHDLESEVSEPNFGAVSGLETEAFLEDTEVEYGKASVAAARNLSPGIFLYGAYRFAYAESEPEPGQRVAPATGGGLIQTRRTLDSDVERMGHAVSAGAVLQPLRHLVVRIDGRGQLTDQEADLDERRSENGFVTGNVGNVVNSSERDGIHGRGSLAADYRIAPRLTLSADASYDYRDDDIESSRLINFAPAQPSEIEEYSTTSNDVRAGPTLRWKLPRGRSLEGGYLFRHRDVDVDVDRLSTQYIVADWQSTRHEAFLHGKARLASGLRGELRARYFLENRQLEDPFIDPLGIANAADAEVDITGWSVIPTLFYQPSLQWSFYASLAVTQLEYEIEGGGPDPAVLSSFADFEYDALTETVTAGVTWTPTDRWSGSVGYSFYNNGESVENQGHDASLSGRFHVTENWALEAGYRFLYYELDRTSIDDYRTHVVRLGVTGSL